VELSSAAGVRCGSHWEFVGPSLCEARAGVNLFSTMRSSVGGESKPMLRGC
jgi:hypothetical protein